MTHTNLLTGLTMTGPFNPMLAIAPELPSHKRGRPPVMLRRALSTAMAQIDACDQGSLRVDELCVLAGVSPRTMRTAFQVTLGMPPSQYIRQRRLHLVRSTLQQHHPGQTTIAAVAHRFGFHDPGRMAADYHSLFGEYPSDTLRRHDVDEVDAVPA